MRVILLFTGVALCVCGQTSVSNKPTWWAKYQYLAKNGPRGGGSRTHSLTAGANVDASDECGPQSETFITLNPANPAMLGAGSNEIFRDPMRGYFSSDGGLTWGAVDLPLPPPRSGTNDHRFGSDPSLAFDTRGNLYYSYIVVFFGNGNGINGSEMAVARSTDGGQTYPFVNFFNFETGGNHSNDKPMITADSNLNSPFRDRVYVAWDASAGGTSGGGIRLGRSSDQGATFAVTRIDKTNGPGDAIGAIPFVGPNGEVYAAWNDFKANAIAFNRSFDGGATWDSPRVIAGKSIPVAIAVPAEFSRGALVYPACDSDRSGGPQSGRLYCSWMDLTAAGTTDIFVSHSDDSGATWSAPMSVTDALSFPVDRFDHWLSVDPTNGDVNVSFYDTRNDTTGFRYMFDVYLTRSTDGGATWLSPNIRVTSVSSNEHDCNGVFPCAAIDYLNQQGDYEGLVAWGGVAHPIWTDSRLQLTPQPGCSAGLRMEEVFTGLVQ